MNIVDGRLHRVVDTGKQYGFIPGRETVDAVFVLRRLTENLEPKIRSFFFCIC